MTQQDDSKAPELDAQLAREPSTSSTGVEGSPKDAAADLAAPYGTRSRNRNGSSRPNYAEDKDIDSDVYDYYHDKKEGDVKKPPRIAGAAGSSDTARGEPSLRKLTADEHRTGSARNGLKEQDSSSVNGSSSQAMPAAAPTQASRKRKAAGQQQNGSSTASTKKVGNAAQQPGLSWPETNMLTFENCNSRPKNGQMVADDGTVLGANDHVYLVCEPPGEPYYLGRIMEFLHVRNDSSRPVDAVRINWYYRPKDIGRKAHDTRLVFATMHSDISPLTALRGKCQIRHRVEIDDLDLYRKTPDSFWFEKLYDRYIQKNYDLIPTSAIVNVPESVKKVLDERWSYVLVEQGRGKELTSAVKLCKRCSGYCASNDSVDCAVCHNTYHMNCVKPPLLKKPSRGFAWSCAACSRAQERKIEAQHAPNASDSFGDADDDEFLDEDEEDIVGPETGRTSPDEDDTKHHQGTPEQIYRSSLWPWRYLGMHCKPEDALDYDDRIYPRASTRIGPRHQATVPPWPGRPVQYEKRLEIKKAGRKDGKLSKEAQAAWEAEKARRDQRPKWVQDEPPGYVRRGEDHDEPDSECTARLLWKPPSEDRLSSAEIENYMAKAKGAAKTLELTERSTNLQDVALWDLFESGYDTKRAFSMLMGTERNDFKDPNPSSAEQKKFEEAVLKHGSELHLVMRHIKTMAPGDVVRYYYTWKKTDRGKHVWGNYTGLRGKKQARRVEAAASKLADDVAHHDDDSAFDAAKALEKKRAFRCQFCGTTSSRQWRRAPNPTPGLVNSEGKPINKEKGDQYIVALCRRCAELWRRYAIRFEDIEEVVKKVAQAGGRAWKRRQDEELLKELQAAQELGFMTPDRDSTPTSGMATANGQEPPRKKLKSAADKESDHAKADGSNGPGSNAARKREKERDRDRPLDALVAPDIPKPRTLPCAVCNQMEPLGDQHICCRECRLTVHRSCYGVVDNRINGKWLCDMCSNDKNPQVSINYKCVLCPVEHTEQDFVELPKLTHHKKKMSEKDREREKIEVQQARKAAEFYRKKQEELNRPTNPREPLKRTADNNWVHVTCAVWTPEVKFRNTKALEPSEGIPSIPRPRYDEVCQACHQKGGACVTCHQCRVPVHVECAHHQGYVLGFDVSPVKGSRRDQHSIVTINGESGTMSAVIWCKDHVPTKTIVHQMHDIVNDSGLNALQFYVQNYKKADVTLTGTVRKANLIASGARISAAPAQPAAARRQSTTATTAAPFTNGAAITNGVDVTHVASDAPLPGCKVCNSCGVDVSLKWWPISADVSQERELANGYHGGIGSEAQKFMEQRRLQCHRCHKERRTPKPPMAILPGTLVEKNQVIVEAGAERPRLPHRVSSLRSPAPLPPASLPDYREAQPASHTWATQAPRQIFAAAGAPLSSSGPAQQVPLAMTQQTSLGTGQSTPVVSHQHSQHSALGSRRPIAGQSYSPPPGPSRGMGYHEWGHRPGSQHGSPPGLLNGGPPPMLNGPSSLSNASSLRPPAISGPPPAGPLMGMSHTHVQAPPPYVKGMPPSPRRMSGPAPPSAYLPPYHGSPASHGPLQPGPSTAVSSRGLPPSPQSRHGPFHQGLHPGRPPYSGIYSSPPGGSRHGLPSALDQPGQPVLPPPRAPEQRPVEHRPAGGASSSASLRNLLS